jgi:hypothetical protein
VPRTEYFAAITDPEEFGERLKTKIDEYRDAQAVQTVTERMEKAYQYHFGLSPAGVHLTSGVQRGGEQGELAEVRVNHLRANALTVLNLTVAPKIAWKPVATNADSASTKAAYLAEALLEYYWLAKEVGHYAAQAVAHAIPLSEGFVFTPWDPIGGEVGVVDPTTGQPVQTGDFAIYNVLPWDVVRDPSKRSWEQCQWVAVCCWHNRYELAARYPEKESEILEADCGTDASERREAFGEIDDVPVWYFYHKRSPIPALKDGLEAVVLGDGTTLSHGKLSYTEIPLHRVTPDEFFGSPYGYSQYHEGLGLQEAIDSLTSAILTNQDAFARQMIAVERGEPFSPEDWGGAKVITYTNKPPQALQLTASPAEAFRFVDVLKADLRRTQGVNDAVQGQLPGDAKLSGAALALLSSQAIQQNSTLQSNYIRMVRSIGNCLLNEWKKRTPQPRKIKLIGKGAEFLCREEELAGKDLESIKEVLVDIGNPLQQTHAGKLELAQMFLQIPGGVQSPEQIAQIATTGKIEHITQGVRDELILIKDENEKMAAGEFVPAMMHDDHLRHGREHRSVLASVAARENPTIVEAAIAHLHEHYKIFFGWPMDQDPTMDPQYREKMLILFGQQPPPGPMGMGPPPGGDPNAPPGAPPAPNGPPPSAGPETKPAENVMGPPEPPGNQVNMPSMPKNPATGERFTPPNGGAPKT